MQEVTEMSESKIISEAQRFISRSSWDLGQISAIWIKRFARGRTDADFAALIGLSTEQVYTRRRVWESFSDVCQNYPNLHWGHFFAALDWDDAHECLKWADDVQAGVAEMKAWRRANRIDD